MTIGPVSGNGALPPEVDLEVMAAGMGPESAIAAATVQLEQAAERSRDARREARAMRRSAQQDEIKEMRRGACLKLASGLVGASSELVSGLTDGTMQTLTKTAGATTNAVLGFFEADAQQEAKRHAMDAQTHGEQVTDHDEAISRAERFADKALGHHEAIARARHEQRTAAIKG